MIFERLATVATWSLRDGSHRENDEGLACVMEAVAYVAGEPWSDKPQCACPVISAFLRCWNDDVPDDATRTRLLGPFVERLVRSKSTPEVALQRSYLALDWLVRVYTPAWLEVAGLRDHAGLCRQLAELHSEAACEAATPTIKGAAAASAAAWAAASAAASASACAAAWAAASAAASDAAKAAGDAGDAGDAANGAAWDAVLEKLSPTFAALQESTVDLIGRMLTL